jgi:hypothetical protein
MYPRAHCTGVGGHSIPLHLAVTGVCACPTILRFVVNVQERPATVFDANE